MQTDVKIYTRGAVTTFGEERTALASLQAPVFTNGYAYRNCWPRSIILQFGDPFLGQFGKAVKSFAMSVRPPAWNNSVPAGRIFVKCGLQARRSGVRVLAEAIFFSFLETSRPATGHTQSPIQVIPGVPSPGVKLPEDEQNTHLHRKSVRLRMSETVSPPHMPSCRVEGNFYLFFCWESNVVQIV